MSRSGYSDDYEEDYPNALALYRGAVASATNGRRGQSFFKALAEAMDAMPEKRLIANDLATPDGAVCAIGALGKTRGVALEDLDPEDAEAVGRAFGIAECLAREVVYMNDEKGHRYVATYSFPRHPEDRSYLWNGGDQFIRVDETPEERWQRMRDWVQQQIVSSDA